MFRVTAVLLGLCLAAALSLTSARAEAQVSVEQARQVHDWFRTGQLQKIWAIRSPHRAPGSTMYTFGRLESGHRDFTKRYGARSSILNERIQPYQGNYHYRCIEQYEHYTDGLHTTWIFDGQGKVVGFTYPSYRTSPMRRQRRASNEWADIVLIVTLFAGSFLFVTVLLVLTLVVVFTRQRRWGKKWALAAKQLGLELEPWHQDMQAPLSKLARSKPPSYPSVAQRMLGKRDGFDVFVGVRVVRRSKSVVYYTYVEVPLEPQLLAGVVAFDNGLMARLAASLGATVDVELGDPEIDRAYVIKALDVDYVRTLFSTPEVRTVLLETRGKRWQLTITDKAVRLERQTLEVRAERLTEPLLRTVRIAASLNAARTRLPAPRVETALSTNWTPVATRHGLALDPRRGVMKGREGGFDVTVEVKYHRGHFWTIFTVQFRQPLGIGLSLMKENAVTGFIKHFGLQDIQVGDPEFDGRFIVKGHPVESVRQFLTADVRALLIQVQEHSTTLTVKDDQLVVELNWFIEEEQHLEGGLDLLTKTARALTKHFTAGEGPYRR